MEINQQLQIVGEIEFQLNNGRRLQEDLETYAKDVNERYFWYILHNLKKRTANKNVIYRVNKLYETIHHNDLKGQTEFCMDFVVEKLKAETDEVLASHDEIMERIKHDYENTPQGRYCFLCLFTRIFFVQEIDVFYV